MTPGQHRVSRTDTGPATGGLALRVQGLSKRFGATAVLEGFDLDVPAGQVVAVVGASGCGKTTLLRLLGGLERVDAGTIAWAPAGQLAFCFQEPRLLPWRRVLDNVALPLELAGVPKAARRQAAAAALARVHLDGWGAALPAQLSGGMRMRAALARALVLRPQGLLLDEPFAALDEVTRRALDAELATLGRETGATVVLVTHSIAEAVRVAERIVVLSPRPARIVDDLATAGCDAAALAARIFGALEDAATEVPR